MMKLIAIALAAAVLSSAVYAQGQVYRCTVYVNGIPKYSKGGYSSYGACDAACRGIALGYLTQGSVRHTCTIQLN